MGAALSLEGCADSLVGGPDEGLVKPLLALCEVRKRENAPSSCCLRFFESDVERRLAGEGLVSQKVVKGTRGATLLLQEFANGVRRTIGRNAKVEVEYPQR